MSVNYKKMMELLKKWPMEKAKGKRCYGFHLRELVKNSFPAGNVFPGVEVEQKAQIDALYRIADNKYVQKFGIHKQVGASGLSIDQLKQVLENDFANKYLRDKQIDA